MEKEKIGLMPLSEEELNDYYAGYGAYHCPGKSSLLIYYCICLLTITVN